MRGIEYGGTAVEKKDLQDAITGEMVYILAISLCLVVAILLISSESWLEPFILLAASGVAVLLNRGTNVMFGEISYITNSIASFCSWRCRLTTALCCCTPIGGRRRRQRTPEQR